MRRRVQDAAQMLGIEQLLARKPGQLSGGQRQRVAMGRAIVREPKAFLMDEPLSNLDAKLRVQMRAEITRIQRRVAATTVYVTHDQTEAMTLGDRIVVMRDGLIQQRGTPDELYSHPRNVFVAGFIGAPSMNLLEATVTPEALRTRLAEIPLTPELRAKLGDHEGEVIVGIRPEDFEDAEIVGSHRRGHTITALVDVLEPTGADLYAHVALNGSRPAAPAEGGSPLSEDVIARLDASSRLREGSEARLWLDTSRLHLFDPASGERLQTRD